MSDEEELRHHLIDWHKGTHMPWFFNDDYGGGWIDVMAPLYLERLHDVLHRMGEPHTDQRPTAEPAKPRQRLGGRTSTTRTRSTCQRPWCRALATRPDRLCPAHGAEQDRGHG